MASVKGRFRTNQEEYFVPDEWAQNHSEISGSNGKFIAVIAGGLVSATLISALLAILI